MQSYKIKKLKKYLFLLSIAFVVAIFSHLYYVFLYFDASEVPTEGGVVKEGIIGEIPSLNPLLEDTDYNQYITGYLYRSLMEYNINEKKFVPSLASCNLDNLAFIKCNIEEGRKWSDGKDVTTKDFVKSFQILKDTDINPLAKAILKNTVIEERKGYITFSTPTRDINILNILRQPVLQADYLANLKPDEISGKLNPYNGIYSGDYVVKDITTDDKTSIKRLVLEKNQESLSNQYIKNISFTFFKDMPEFFRNQDKINAFYDKNKVVGDTLPRFNNNKYYLNQFVGAFVNAQKITNTDLRGVLLSYIDKDRLLGDLDQGNIEVNNPYLTDVVIDKEPENKNIEALLQEKGYYKKSGLITQIVTKKENEIIDSKMEEINPVLKYIISPVTRSQSFIDHDDFRLEGEIPAEDNVTSVWINDYKLKGFKAGNKTFLYRLKEEFGNIKKGLNKYKIYFEEGGQKILKEEFDLYYNNDVNKLKDAKQAYYETLRKRLKDNLELDVEMTKEELAEVEKLDKKYFYNSDLKKFTLRILYIDSQKDALVIAEHFKNNLAVSGIEVELVPISVNALLASISDGSKDYDIIIAGIDLGYFDFNLFPYFHSSQAKNGNNFSNIKKPELDILLEELKENNLSEKKRDLLKNKVLEILSKEHIVKTIYSPCLYYLTDKNIKNFKKVEHTPDMDLRKKGYLNAYITFKKQARSEERGLISFIKFLYKIMVGKNG
ncbi:MAG: ABC transporter substrate-binding protein [Candidatus Gracilibacteria bacterium]|nr:ABC transporter substrate-binding protein [Candidatus Gracilibacteria bacterium]